MNDRTEKNIKLTIQYDGTNYAGWQTQRNASTVQDVLEKALKKLTKENIKLIGASRTDGGVHAMGQVANFHTFSNIPPEKFPHALNPLLPDDIVIAHSCLVPEDFHARFSAKGKRYEYHLYTSLFPSPFFRHRACHIIQALNVKAMMEASAYLIGTHDFTSFRASGCSAISPVRTVNNIQITNLSSDFIKIEVEGESFLYNMVRIIAGTLCSVGMGKLLPSDMVSLLKEKDRRKAGKTLPAHGLYLCEVYYG